MHYSPLPNKVQIAIGKETTYFSLKTDRLSPILPSILISTCYTIFLIPFLLMYFSLLFTKPYTGDLLGKLIMTVIISLNVYLLLSIMSSIFKKNIYIVATKTRLIIYENEYITEINWSDFSQRIKITDKENKGTLRLIYSNKENTPDVVFIIDIPQVNEIAQICKNRINENKKIN